MGEASKEKKGRMNKVVILAIILIVGLFVLIVMLMNSRKPDPITLEKLDTKVKGAAFVETNQAIIKQMYKNWLPNDLFWPTIFLDNMPNFQIGQLEVIRYNIRVLRDNLTRVRTTDKLDPNAEEAFTALSNDPYKWWFPSAESKWRLAYDNLETYYQRLLA